MSALIQLLVDCEAFLRSVGEIFWADKMKRVVDRGRTGLDAYLLEEVMSWYGGMGSFNDLMISECNDHLVDGRSEEKLNDELSRIRSAIYQAAVRLKRG